MTKTRRGILKKQREQIQHQQYIEKVSKEYNEIIKEITSKIKVTISYKEVIDRGYLEYGDEEILFSTKELTIIIPNKDGQTPYITLNSLQKSIYQDFDIFVINDTESNVCRARNRGFNYVTTPFVLFSDNDIEWYPESIGNMVQCLKENPKVSYVYGSFKIGDRSGDVVHFEPNKLKIQGYISTMSIMRSDHFPGFDENIKYIQDWDLYLTMLESGHIGKNIGYEVFSTPLRPGITTELKASKQRQREARNKILLKHKLS